MSVRGVPEKDPTFPSNPEFPSRIVTEGLVSYWTMDDKDLVGTVPNATVKDIWGDNDGTTSGTLTTGATGKINEALEFDGENDEISLSKKVGDGQTELSVALWFNMETSSGDTLSAHYEGQQLVASVLQDDAWLINEGSGELDWYIGDGAGHNLITSGLNLQTGTWYHVVGVYDGNAGTQKIYLNAKQKNASNIGTGSIIDPGNDQFIGSGGGHSWEEHFDGTIDDVRIYDRALSETEIRRNYLATRNKLGRGFPAQPIFP